MDGKTPGGQCQAGAGLPGGENAWTLDRQALGILQRLCAWRLNEARKRDLAVNFVVREAHLLQWPSARRAAW
ncbi:HRDC domain-containing protein [Oceanimonas sp. NS1]|nr:HRDC domain-containing protein [Oceanimonas sp. NS1]